MSETPILDLEREPPEAPKRRWRVLLFLCICLCIGAGIGAVNEHKQFNPAWPAFHPLLFFPAIYFSVAVHEAGHLLAGMLAGFETGGIGVGGMSLLKMAGRWIFRFNRKSGLCGFYLPHLSPAQFNRSRAALMVAAGPFASLVLSLACFYPGSVSTGFANRLAGSVFWASTLILIASGIPYRIDMTRSDGSRLLQLMRDPEDVHSWFALLAVQAENAQGVRPRDWNPELCRLAFSLDANNPEYANRQYLASYRALDEGSETLFLQHLENALAASGRCGKAFQHCLYLEAAAASARMRMRSQQARNWYQRACKLRKPELAAPVEAAIAMAEGRYQDAIAYFQQASAYMEKRRIDTGTVRLAQEEWAADEEACRRALRETVRVS